METGAETFLLVEFHAVTAQRDAAEMMALAQLFHQLKAVPIRQAEIAQHNIETVLAGDLERGLDAVSDMNGVTGAGEEANMAAAVVSWSSPPGCAA